MSRTQSQLQTSVFAPFQRSYISITNINRLYIFPSSYTCYNPPYPNVLINFNQRRPVHSISRHHCRGIILLRHPRHQSPNSQTPRKTLLIREWSKEVTFPIRNMYIRDRNRDGQIRSRNVNHRDIIRGSNCALDAEKLRTIFGSWDCLHCQRRKGRETDDVDIGT